MPTKLNPTKRLIILFTYLLLQGCENINISKETITHFETEDYNPKIAKQNKVVKRSKYEILNEDQGPPVRKLRLIDYFDTNGLCTLSVAPNYHMVKVDTSGFHKLDPIEQFKFQFEKEGIEPTGYNDSTFYTFDKYSNLIRNFHKETNIYGGLYSKSNLEIKYDKYGNSIKRCIIDHEYENICSYTTYNYNESKKAISMTVSSSRYLTEKGDENPISHTFNFTYNDKGQLLSDGEFSYEYFPNGRIKAKYSGQNDQRKAIHEYQYDNMGNLTKYIHYYGAKNSFTEINMYDDSNLIIEKKVIYSDRKEVTLFKYEYNFTSN